MPLLSVQWDLRALWATLTVVSKLYLLFLSLAGVYTGVALIRRGTEISLPRLHYLSLLLFGVCISNECFGALRAIQLSRASLSPVGIEVFGPAIALSFVVFTVLTLLHLLQWFQSSRR